MSARRRLDEVATSLYVHGRAVKFFKSLGLDPWMKSEYLLEYLIRSPVALETFMQLREVVLKEAEDIQKDSNYPQKKAS